MKKTLALIQMNVVAGDVEHNYKHVVELLDEAMQSNPDIIVLPETWNTGFHPSEDLPNLADPDGERTNALFSTYAKDHNVNIVAGSVSVLKHDQVFNTSYAFNREGRVVGEYSKMHGFTPAKEDKYFAGGTHVGHFELDGIPCSTVICYDIRFPEVVRMAALPGTELLFVPAQWPTMRLRHWQVLNEVRAIENQLFLCAVNGCGAVGRAQSTGHSALFDPWGTNLLEMDTTEGVGIVEIDLSTVEDIRNKINIFRDRKPELYTL